VLTAISGVDFPESLIKFSPLENPGNDTMSTVNADVDGARTPPRASEEMPSAN